MQVAGDNHHECKSNLKGKHRQHRSCRKLVMAILHGHKDRHVSNQMQVAQEQENDCGGGEVVTECTVSTDLMRGTTTMAHILQ